MLGINEKKELSRKSPEKAPAILSRVNQLVSQGLQQAAIDLLEATVSVSPNDSSLLSALGRVYLLNRQPEKAVIYLRRSLAQSSSKSVQANSYASEAFTDADAAYLDEVAEDPANEEYSALDEIEAASARGEKPQEDCSRKLYLNKSRSRLDETKTLNDNEPQITVVKRRWKGGEPEQKIELAEKLARPAESHKPETVKSGSFGIEEESVSDAIGSLESAETNAEPAISPHIPPAFIQPETEQSTILDEYESEEAEEEIELLELEIDDPDVIEADEDFDDDLDDADPELDLAESGLLDDEFASEDFGWEDLDDFEENASRDNEDDELVQMGITRAERARQVAIEVLSRVGWDREHLPILEAVFVESGWGAARVAIEHQIERGAGPEEIVLARHIRTIWFSNEHLWTSFKMKSNAPFMQAEAVYKNFSWADALRLIRCYPSIPDEAEIQAFIDDVYDEWYSHNRLRKHFKAFLNYFRYRIIATKRTLPGDIPFMFSSSVEAEWGADNPELLSSISEMRSELRELGADSGFEIHGADNLFKIPLKEAFDDEKES